MAKTKVPSIMDPKDKEGLQAAFVSDKLIWDPESEKMVLAGKPNRMTIRAARETLDLVEKEGETVVMVNEIVQAYPLEGAYAFIKAMQRKFGWSTPLPGGFFKQPPATITLHVSHKESVQVIWGRFAVPGIEGELQTGMTRDNGRLCFCIQGQVKKLYLDIIKSLADLTREIVREESIYRGKAINLSLDNEGEINWGDSPTFIDHTKVNESEIIFSRDLSKQVETNLFTPMRRTQECRALGIPLKRGVLLEGPWGVGKTIVSALAARVAVENGWTYVAIKRASGLASAIEFARLYQPAVLFCEDIDREVDGDERTEELDDILNTIDGIGAKGTDLMVVLTSNHVESINQAMLRPGRLDAVIHVGPPDAEAAIRLVKLFGARVLAPNEDLTLVGEALDGRTPAVIREVVERSKLYAVSQAPRGVTPMIGPGALLAAVAEMDNHLKLLQPKSQEKSVGDRLVDVLRESITEIGPEAMRVIERARQAADNARDYADHANDEAAGARKEANSALYVASKVGKIAVAIADRVGVSPEDAIANGREV